MNTITLDNPAVIYVDRQVNLTLIESQFNLPDHTQLPDRNGDFVKNFQEHPQSILLTESLWPQLRRIHPDGQFAIGQDCGIYWRLTTPLEKGAESPDWFYVPNVPPTLEGQMRRSYVMWQEYVPPLIALEFVSGNGSEERDSTPYKGKFWVYEQAIHIPYYGIYEVTKNKLDLYHLVNGVYQPMPTNARGHYKIEEMGVELGLWTGSYKNVTLPWLRWWDNNGNLLLHPEETQQVMQQQMELLMAKLRELGVNPETVLTAATTNKGN